MKKLKIFLIISLFSFIFLIGNVYAVVSYSTQNFNALNNYLNNGNSINDFQNLLLDNYDFKSIVENYNNYLIYYDVSNGNNSHTFYIKVLYSNNDIFLSMNNSSYLYVRDNFNWTEIQFNFNSNYNGFNNISTLSSAQSTFLNIDNASHFINILPLFSNLQEYKYLKPSGSSWNPQPFSIDNGTTYNLGNDIPLNYLGGSRYSYDVIDIFSTIVPITCTRNQVLGAVSNATDLVFKIKGVSNALAKPIWGRIMLEFSDSSFHTDDEFNVEFINFLENEDADVQGSYSFTCNDTGSACSLEYSYNYIDDIDTNVEFGFKVSPSTGNTMPSFIKLFNCFDNDDFYNITYTYNNSSGGTISNDNVLNNFLQDGSVPDVSGLSDTNIIPTGPVDSILTLPLNIMRSLLNTLNSSTCSPLVLPIPFSGGNLILPCISTLYSKINGLNVFLTWFSSIFSAFLLYQYFIYLYKWVDDTLTFRENNHFGGY